MGTVVLAGGATHRYNPKSAMEKLQLHYVDMGTPRTFDLEDERGHSVGRTEGNDLILNHPSVSRRHGRFEVRDDHWWVVDQGSTNGIKVNGSLVTEAAIKAGDKLSVGSLEVEVEAVPSVDFSEDAFEETSGTVIRRISDFNVEFGLDEAGAAEEAKAAEPAEAAGPGPVTREKILSVLVQVAKALMQSEELNSVLNTVMEIIFKYLAVERGLLILFDDDGNAIPKLAKFRDESADEQIPISRTILKMVKEQQVSLLTQDALEDWGGKSIAIHGIKAAMCVPLWHKNKVIGAIQVDSPIHIGRFTEEDLDLLTALANFAAVAIERAQLSQKIEQEKKIRGKLERYHSPAVIEEIVQNADVADAAEIKNAEVSILFADITGFTTISETKKPEEVSEFLANFFSCAVEAIFANGGTLDKFIGDAVLAFFGAPLEQSDHAERAVRAGLMMHELVHEWNEERAKEELPEVKIRVGINSGPAVVGNVGTEKRVDYTVLGSSVNIASRLESSVAKPGDLVISEMTRQLLADDFEFEMMGEFPLKGISKPMPVYKVVRDVSDPSKRPDLRHTISS